jgi:hypothetical protein
VYPMPNTTPMSPRLLLTKSPTFTENSYVGVVHLKPRVFIA